MRNLTIDTTTVTPVELRIVADGSATDYQYETVPLTKPRLDELRSIRVKMARLRKKAADGKAGPADELAAANQLAAAVDGRLRPVAGAPPIAELWDSGNLGVDHLAELMQRLNENERGGG